MTTAHRLVDYFVISGLDIASGLEPDQLSGEGTETLPPSPETRESLRQNGLRTVCRGQSTTTGPLSPIGTGTHRDS